MLKKIFIVILITLISINCYSKSNKNEIKAEIIWKKNIDKKIGNINSKINLNIINDILFINSSKGNLFTIKENKILWKKNIKDKIKSGPYGNKKIIITISKKNKIHAINPISGKTVFKKTLIKKPVYDLKVTNNNMYINIYGNSIFNFNINNMKKISFYSSATQNINIDSGTNIISSNGNIFNIHSNGRIISINKKNNFVNWNKLIYNNTEKLDYKKINDTTNKPIIYNKILYSSNLNKEFVVIDTINKNIIWKKKFKNDIKFIIKKKSILITTTNGKIYKLNKINGNKIWKKNLNTKNLTTPLKLNKINCHITFDKYGNLYLIKKDANIKKIKTKIKNIEKDPVKNSKDNIYILQKNGNLLYVKINKYE